MRTSSASSRIWSALAVTAIISSVTGCGDVDTFKIRSSQSGHRATLTSWNGTVVRLIRTTTPCDSQANEGLIVPVGTPMEFPGEHVAKLKSACSGGSEAEVSIDVEARSVIFDFSSVTRAGAFTAANFNGYVLTDIADAAPELLGATIDRGASTLELADDAVQAEGRVVRANFEGIRFDDTGFVKIDLLFEGEE
jgi:hypothetical protein